ncbi:biopolymer transporter ExbB [Pseudogemmobacter faecipullorum]|uniref:Biopolymer transporter ExbB n=1 Tax=Pseudogemmobacter faecipullorum TaxID=2755041 RepID=A0ABS8CHT8_9RHOB|nr:biopolymer transporter ExbB [Pseudogemmobacter faecipullorum]MCB5408951.1 biopolymer transporter ExbB [Pseudogemmobacter faecipullorum]
MQRSDAVHGTTFSQPIRAITTMLIVSLLIGAVVWFLHGSIARMLAGSHLALSGLILFVFGLGVITCFWQVFTLAKSVSWIENYVRRSPGSEEAVAPVLLAPLAALLKSRGSHNVAISASSGRTILESVAQRIDEARDITRYLSNLLVFLGLLGTFWGLATTVPAVVETIRSLAPSDNESGMAVFGRLMNGLEGQLGGMGTAFTTSLLGLGGSLVVGLLELFAGHGQNRFYRELEEWLSSITRIGLSEGEGGSADQSAIVQVLDHVVSQMESLQGLYTQADQARSVMEERMADLAKAVDRLGERLQAGAAASEESLAAMTRMADGQDQLLAHLAEQAREGPDAESRMRLRSIDVQMLRILEELSAGRQEMVADLRHDLAQLTMGMRQISRQLPGAGTSQDRG